jgi:NarL family two-component system response regulator LiaR
MTTNSLLTDTLTRKIRIVLADDHPLMRQAIGMWLEKQQDLEVIAEANNGKEAIDIAVMLQPDIVIIDISMPKINGLEATRQITSKCPNTEVLALTVHGDTEHIHGMLQAGASGYLMKNVSGEEVVHAVRAVFAGENVLPNIVPEDSTVDSYGDNAIVRAEIVNPLSLRELKVLKWVASGLSNKDIAVKMELSLRSVKAILTSIFVKMNAASRTEAISIGLKTGVLTLKDLRR